MHKLFSKILVPEKRKDFQITIVPPEAPTEGMNSKASKEVGQIFLMNKISKDCFFVSWTLYHNCYS
jgi:hypothetical protein